MMEEIRFTVTGRSIREILCFLMGIETGIYTLHFGCVTRTQENRYKVKCEL